jgi:signal peptidase I
VWGLDVCKRIAATSGEVVSYTDKWGYTIYQKVPEGHVWLLGDNPANSHDSRYYGPVPLEKLQGRVFLKIGKNPWHCCPIDEIVHKSKDEALVEQLKEGEK